MRERKLDKKRERQRETERERERERDERDRKDSLGEREGSRSPFFKTF